MANSSASFAGITGRRKMKAKLKGKKGMPPMMDGAKKGMPPAFMKKKGAKKGR